MKLRFARAISIPASKEYFVDSARFPLDVNVCLSYIRKMKRISMFFSEVHLAALRKLSKKTGIKVSELVRRFVEEGLKKS